SGPRERSGTRRDVSLGRLLALRPWRVKGPHAPSREAPAAPPAPLRSSLLRGDAPEQSVTLVVGSGREKQRVRGPGVHAVAEPDAPQAVDGERMPVRRLEMSLGLAGGEVIGVDAAVAEIADEQVAAEAAEPGGRDGQAPGRVEGAARGDPAEKVPL